MTATGRRGLAYRADVPELPEVETIRRQLEAPLTSRRICDAGAFPSAKFNAATAAIGARIAFVGRRGKYLLLDLDDGRELIIHLGMTGVLQVVSPARPCGSGSSRATARTAGFARGGTSTTARRWSSRINDASGGSRSCLVAATRPCPPWPRSAPNPSDPTSPRPVSTAALAASDRTVKTSLLGQRVVAGVGNIYADEALWRAGINPVARRVGPARATSLHQAIVDVLAAAVDHGGTRLRNYRTIEGDTGAHQWHLDCYGRAGRPCARCGTALQRRVVDGRGTTWCPKCQAR